jgi:flagellin-like protein
MKKGLSPVVATVLLISIVIILALIIFFWAKSFVGEAVEQKGIVAEQACSEISLETAYIDDKLQVSNNGNIPVYRLEVNGEKGGSISKIESVNNLRIGQSREIEVGDFEKLEVLPIILGKGRNTQKNYKYQCENNIFIVE